MRGEVVPQHFITANYTRPNIRISIEEWFDF